MSTGEVIALWTESSAKGQVAGMPEGWARRRPVGGRETLGCGFVEASPASRLQPLEPTGDGSGAPRRQGAEVGPPSRSRGLSAAEVAERVARGQVNAADEHTSRTVGEILR